jgi:hypothetical protein
MKSVDGNSPGLLAIAATTALTGLTQVLLPQPMLRVLSTENTPTSQHFFRTIGMFMVVVGGALVHALSTNADSRVLVLWTAVQKLGASAAVGIGVKQRVFSPLALFVASFDLLCGVYALGCWWRATRGADSAEAKR